MSNDDEIWECVGSRMIVISRQRMKTTTPRMSTMSRTTTTTTTPHNQRGYPKEGMVTVYCNADGTKLRVDVCDGRKMVAYSKTFSLNDVNLPSDEREQLPLYLIQDDKKHPNIPISFQYKKVAEKKYFTNDNRDDDDDGDGMAIQLIIQQKLMDHGIMKYAYRGTLSEKVPMMSFCNSLGEAVNQSRQTINQLQIRLEETEEAVRCWKDTADRLDREVWQKEKDQLLDNFLKLWNEFKARTKKQVDELEEELKRAKTCQSIVSSSSTASKRSRAMELLDDIPDDLDGQSQEPIPMEDVKSLAQGRRIRTSSSSRKRILKEEETLSLSALKQKEAEYKRQQKERAAKKQKKDDREDVRDGIDDDDDDDSVIEVYTRSPATKRARRPQQQRPSPQPSSQKSSTWRHGRRINNNGRNKSLYQNYNSDDEDEKKEETRRTTRPVLPQRGFDDSDSDVTI